MDDVVIARALHVLAVVIWIGGVSMVTTVALPAIRRGALGGDWLQALSAIEHRFAWQARIAVVIALRQMFRWMVHGFSLSLLLSLMPFGLRGARAAATLRR
jgi:uncharacterized membrane protein